MDALEWCGRRWVALLVLCLVGVTGCSGGFPADPDQTLETIRETGVMRAGASHNPPLVVHPETDGGDPTGTEVDLIEAYAEHLGVDVEWMMGSETALFEALQEGQVDLVVAGLLDDSEWTSKSGLTRPYTEETAPDGSTRKRVVATPAGENALMTDLERWFDTYEGANG